MSSRSCVLALANGFAKYYGIKRRLTFRNKEYRSAFDLDNLTLSGAGQPS